MSNSKCRMWRMGILGPAVLIALGLADLALRLVPLDSFAFRTWERVVHNLGGPVPFKPNVHCRVANAYGDMVKPSSRFDLRELHDEVFTTDALGYRNPPELLSNLPPSVLLFGSSFSAGCGVSDEQTLSAGLARELNCRVYNAADGPADPATMEKLAQTLHMRSGVVLLELLERTLAASGGTDLNLANEGAPAAAGNRMEPKPTEPWRMSRLGILARRMTQYARGRLIAGPNPNFRGARLVSGDAMIFYAPQLGRPYTGNPQALAQYCAGVAARLRKQNLSLVTFLVPEKATIYGPLLADASCEQTGQPSLLAGIEQALKTNGVAVVNLEPVLLKQAALECPLRKYIYRRDDSHWNERGILTAVRAITPEVRGIKQFGELGVDRDKLAGVTR